MILIKRLSGIVTAIILAVFFCFPLCASVAHFVPLWKLIGVVTYGLPIGFLCFYIWSLLVKNSKLASLSFWLSIAALALCVLFWNGLLLHEVYLKKGHEVFLSSLTRGSIQILVKGLFSFYFLIQGYFSLLDENELPDNKDDYDSLE